MWRIVFATVVLFFCAVVIINCQKKVGDVEICQKECYPNPVDRVVGKQCFCQATIIIREVGSRSQESK